jgi:hypothetical protein
VEKDEQQKANAQDGVKCNKYVRHVILPRRFTALFPRTILPQT